MFFEDEYVVFQSYIVPSKTKGKLPNVEYIFLADSLFNPSYTKDLKKAYKFYDLNEAKKTANLLDMEIGILEISVKKIK